MAAVAPDVVPVYGLTDDHLAFREVIRQIARERVAPRAAEIDARSEFPEDLRRLFAEQDLFGLPFEEVHGGTGTGSLMLCVAIEEIAKACASSALLLAVQDLGSLPIRLAGSEELKARVLPRLASGEWLAAFALSEPEAGSDPRAMRTRARRDGDEWVLDGAKNWITNAGVAEAYSTTLGWGSPRKRWASRRARRTTRSRTRGSASRSAGRSTSCRGSSSSLADMETRCAAARELLYRAAAKAERCEPDLGKYSAMAKLFCSDTAMDVTVEAVQVLGGYGYVSEYPVERMMRDAKLTQIYEGTNEIQRVVIARALR
jgi:alkylation response protein AidB-like acyl-CoA dehydrogenase